MHLLGLTFRFQLSSEKTICLSPFASSRIDADPVPFKVCRTWCYKQCNGLCRALQPLKWCCDSRVPWCWQRD